MSKKTGCMSQAEIARRLNITRQYVSILVNAGELGPTIDPKAIPVKVAEDFIADYQKRQREENMKLLRIFGGEDYRGGQL